MTDAQKTEILETFTRLTEEMLSLERLAKDCEHIGDEAGRMDALRRLAFASGRHKGYQDALYDCGYWIDDDAEGGALVLERRTVW